MAAKVFTPRVVGPDEAHPAPKTTLEAAQSDDRLAELKAMRARIARAIDDTTTPARDLASLTRRQMEIGREVESLKIALEQESGHGDSVEDEPFDASAI